MNEHDFEESGETYAARTQQAFEEVAARRGYVVPGDAAGAQIASLPASQHRDVAAGIAAIRAEAVAAAKAADARAQEADALAREALSAAGWL
jgi:hypothetical protein